MMNLFTVIVILFLIMDPFGNISSFQKLMQYVPAERRNKVILREMVFALILMLLFNIIGEGIFYALDLSELTVRVASGTILFLTAIKILFPTMDSPRANLPNEEPYLIPLAIPLIAGPSALATIMLFAHVDTTFVEMNIAIFVSWALALGVLLSGKKLHELVGDNGLLAFEKLMGMILVMLAIQRFAEGIQQFVTKCVNC
ncbi:MAG: MarC family protein [Parachlamydiales bacterium]|jgi:multiple antibiotic resistance protein